METSEQEATSEVVGRLAAGLVHELNTPLGALASANDTLARAVNRLREAGGGHDRQLAAMLAPIHCIEQGAARIGQVVQVLERLERLINHREGDRVIVDLRTALNRSLGAVADAFAEDVRVECRLDGRPAPIRCNLKRLEGALSDLIQSAAHSVRDGGEITLCVERLGSHAEVWIADNGPGMSAEELKDACSLRFAPHDGRVRLRLGLAACKQAIESEGGHLYVESAPGHGTQLRVRLPLHSAETAPRSTP